MNTTWRVILQLLAYLVFGVVFALLTWMLIAVAGTHRGAYWIIGLLAMTFYLVGKSFVDEGRREG